MFTHKNAWRVVLDALTDHHFAANIEEIEDPIDCAAGCGICQFLLTSAQPVDGLKCGIFSSADKLKLEEAFQIERTAERREAGGHRYFVSRAQEMGKGKCGECTSIFFCS